MIASFSADSLPGNAAVAATPHPSALRAATFPKGEGFGWCVKLQFTAVTIPSGTQECNEYCLAGARIVCGDSPPQQLSILSAAPLAPEQARKPRAMVSAFSR